MRATLSIKPPRGSTDYPFDSLPQELYYNIQIGFLDPAGKDRYMKKIYNALVVCLAISGVSIAGPTLPKKVRKIIIWDIDDVLLRLNKGGITKRVLGYVAWGAPHKLSLFKYGASKAMGYQKTPAATPSSLTTFIPEGPTYSIAKHLQQIPYGDEYFKRIGTIVNEERTYVAGMKEVLEDIIKQDDVLIVAATNKDRIAFQQTAHKLGLEKYFHVIYTSDTDPAGELLPDAFKKSLNAPLIGSTEGFLYKDQTPIHKHIAQRKPHLEYFNQVTSLTQDFMRANGLDTETVESITFIDDKQENLNAFNKSLHTTPFKTADPQPTIQIFKFDKKKDGAVALLKSGVISVTTKPAIIQKIALNKRYSQWGGSLLQVWDKLRNMIVSGSSQ